MTAIELAQKLSEWPRHLLAGWPGRPPRARLEAFGAIIQLERPHALVFVDRTYARRAGLVGRVDPPVWRDPAADGRLDEPLSAPLEAHLQLTDRCSVGCRGCYVGATPAGGGSSWGLPEWRGAVDELAGMGVFHLALGGGESADLPWLGQLARHARDRGMIPNLTTSGLSGVDSLLAIAAELGQINVSIDGLGETYRAIRGVDGFAAADRSLRRLRQRMSSVGINLVLTRHNFEQLDSIFAYARSRRLNEVEILRYKPAGRGRREYAAMRCTDQQHRLLLPAVLAACRRHRVRARLDCSLVPMIAYHQPDPGLLRRLAVYGCAGGDHLVAATAAGVATACSFAPAPPERPRIDQLASYWPTPVGFTLFRSWRRPPEPCRSCRYHPLCRGGCRAVSLHVDGDATAPDPECPRLLAASAPPHS